mmetsp:Transcript_20103/g.57043  ORF Transcript_20103/g.57043 Transcript_20103/m.57043 type:complete len:262 (+) Transcript_20103:139-924(+)
MLFLLAQMLVSCLVLVNTCCHAACAPGDCCSLMHGGPGNGTRSDSWLLYDLLKLSEKLKQDECRVTMDSPLSSSLSPQKDAKELSKVSVMDASSSSPTLPSLFVRLSSRDGRMGGSESVEWSDDSLHRQVGPALLLLLPLEKLDGSCNGVPPGYDRLFLLCWARIGLAAAPSPLLLGVIIMSKIKASLRALLVPLLDCSRPLSSLWKSAFFISLMDGDVQARFGMRGSDSDAHSSCLRAGAERCLLSQQRRPVVGRASPSF